MDDFVKIKKSQTKYNYLLYFATHDNFLIINASKLEQQIIDAYDGRQLRYFTPSLIKIEHFTTWFSSENDTKTFSLLLWKIKKRQMKLNL